MSIKHSKESNKTQVKYTSETKDTTTGNPSAKLLYKEHYHPHMTQLTREWPSAAVNCCKWPWWRASQWRCHHSRSHCLARGPLSHRLEQKKLYRTRLVTFLVNMFICLSVPCAGGRGKSGWCLGCQSMVIWQSPLWVMRSRSAIYLLWDTTSRACNHLSLSQTWWKEEDEVTAVMKKLAITAIPPWPWVYARLCLL